MPVKFLDTLEFPFVGPGVRGSDCGIDIVASYSGILELSSPDELDLLAFTVDGLNIQQSSGQLKAFDRFKLDQMTETTTVSAEAQLAQDVVIGRHEDTINFVPGNWEAYTTTAGLPTNVGSGGTKTNYVRVPDNVTITEARGSASGVATATLQAEAGFVNERVYRIDIPQQSPGTNVWTVYGTITSITEVDLADLFKIDQANVDVNYRRVIESAGGSSGELSSLQSKVDALFPLTVDVSRLTAWADIYDPVQAVTEVIEASGYSSLVDFRGTDASNRYESTGITYTGGSGISDYDGLTDDLHRCFGFRVSGASNLTLLSIGSGASAIPFIDITAAGNLRVNDYTPARTVSEEVTGDTRVITTPASGTGTLTAGGPVSTYTMPDYPANTTNQSRVISVELDVLVDGNDSRAGGFIDFPIPNDVTAQAQGQVTHTFFLGFPSNRRVTATFNHEFRVSGSDLVLDISLATAPSDITFRVGDVAVTLAYTASSVIARVDNFLTFSDAGGTFTFSGDTEFLIGFQPIPDTSLTRVVPVALNISAGTVTELNDNTVKDPVPGFNKIEVPDTIEFRSFLPDHFLRHVDLDGLVRNRATRFVYELAREEVLRTEHAVTEPIDLASGSKVGGDDILRENVVLQVADVASLVTSVQLPANYTDFTAVILTERIELGATDEWRNIIVPTILLSSGVMVTSDVIRSQGNTDYSWTPGTRTLTTVPSSANIYSCVLI